MQVRKQQLELNMEQKTGSQLGMEYVKYIKAVRIVIMKGTLQVAFCLTR